MFKNSSKFRNLTITELKRDSVYSFQSDKIHVESDYIPIKASSQLIAVRTSASNVAIAPLRSSSSTDGACPLIRSGQTVNDLDWGNELINEEGSRLLAVASNESILVYKVREKKEEMSSSIQVASSLISFHPLAEGILASAHNDTISICNVDSQNYPIIKGFEGVTLE
jgi:hypothetical protein